jgi:hypothetical protein
MWVMGPQAKAKDGMRMKPAARNMINDMCSSYDDDTANRVKR